LIAPYCSGVAGRRPEQLDLAQSDGLPATSVSSERAFSAANDIISERRSKLKPDNAEMLLFLKRNLDFY